jgi:aspartyl-tRNA(Asn)/glutamyl-tRNA(Gln) amidotransferase subunit C
MIDPETFSHLVDLASFEFEPDQADYLCRELNNQLKTIDELAAVPLDDTLPQEIHGLPYPPANSQGLRPDEITTFTERDALTGQFPKFEDGYVVVPDIPHEELD